MPDDHSESVPPLPIPNRTVKRLHAADSADSRVKVGNRQAPQQQQKPHPQKVGFLRLPSRKKRANAKNGQSSAGTGTRHRQRTPPQTGADRVLRPRRHHRDGGHAHARTGTASRNCPPLCPSQRPAPQTSNGLIWNIVVVRSAPVRCRSSGVTPSRSAARSCNPSALAHIHDIRARVLHAHPSQNTLAMVSLA
ncbi:MAG: hypothetical protein QOC89_1157, partial [Paraburkholderia sp.]|nr:hypothetical protein [Paraburkholderia sp.]